MRADLKPYFGQRIRVAAVVGRRGSKPGYKGPVETILLTNVCEAKTGSPLTDHIWFTVAKWARLLREGARIEFNARVGQYRKGYLGRREDVDAPVEIDYRFERPTAVMVVEEAPGVDPLAPELLAGRTQGGPIVIVAGVPGRFVRGVFQPAATAG